MRLTLRCASRARLSASTTRPLRPSSRSLGHSLSKSPSLPPSAIHALRALSFSVLSLRALSFSVLSLRASSSLALRFSSAST